MPFDRDVTIDFNADISGYSASMGQMIQQTSQYSAAADGMIGKIGKLNNVVMAGVKSMAAFTGTNKVATAQAAAYQQQLSKIETSAKVNNKSFKELEKTTKGLAKDFPIGMKQAVQQVESLQEAGVTTNKEISSLAKTFTKLGAATGTFGPEMGQNMLQLNRTFQNGTGNMEKYADSLTQVTHQFGANAGAVTNFAKSIAPVAATVGMNETSVIGLSTAFSRLGEDGYAAANTFNKVMLDMSKSIREGTPEAKIYAEVMGTTSENLKATWESNPAEGFIDFVESIKSQGSDGIRSLEQLGLEGVRTQKTIMALATSGDMREIVETAQSSYGGGQTGEAAETAMGGVNDQLTMLNETMAQTTATAGKPFLGFLEKVLSVANGISKVIASIVESDFIQSFGKIIGVAGAAFGAVKLLNSVAVTGAFAQLIGRGVAGSGPVAGFRAGFRGGLTGGAGEGAAARAGAYSRLYLGGGGGTGDGPRGIRGVGQTLRNFANVGGNAAALYARSNASLIARALRENPEQFKTAAGQRFVAGQERVMGARSLGTWAERRAEASAGAKEMAAASKEMGKQAGGVSSAMKAYASQTAMSARYVTRAGAAGARGLGTIGSAATMGLLSGTGAVVGGGVALAAGVGYAYYRGQKKEQEAVDRGGKDAYRIFNDFAEKAGIATKGLVTFSQALAESTSKIASQSKTAEEAYKLTDQERLQASAPGYERARSTRGDSFWDKLFPSNFNPEKEAVRIRGMLGENASPEAINRVQMDLINQVGEQKATATMTHLSGLDKLSSKQIEDLLTGAGDKSQTLGIFGSTESAEFKEMAEAERARRVNMEKSIYGEDYVTAQGGTPGVLGGFAGAEGGFAAATKANEEGDWKARAQSVDDMVSSLNLSADEQGKLDVQMNKYFAELAKGGEEKDLPQIMKDAGLDTLAASYQAGLVGTGMAAGAGSYSNMTEEQKAAAQRSAGEKAAATSVELFKDMGRETGTLAEDMAGTAKIVRDSGMSLEDWTKAVDDGKESATDLQKAWADVKLAPGDVNAQQRLTSAASAAASEQAKAAGGGTDKALEILESSLTTSTGAEIPAIQQAMAYTESRRGIDNFTVNKVQQQTDVIKRGTTAQETLNDPEKAKKLTDAQLAIEKDYAAKAIQTQTQVQDQKRAWMIQDRRQQEDFGIQQARMEESFQLQSAYAAEDYAKQRKYMIQDYHTSVKNAEADFHKQRLRAQRDFDKQVKRQSEQTAKNMFDPYSRIAAQTVTDVGVLMQSLLEQNNSVRDQLKSVDKLSSMGLSKDAIDQLKLMDPTQNAQVQRLLGDAMTDPTAINKINDLIKTRLKMGAGLTTSEYNKDFTNMKDDFGQSMDDMADDFDENMERGEKAFKRGLKRNGEAFATAQSRAAAAHALALEQMDADNERARTRSIEDLEGMATEYTDKYVDIEKKFLQDLADLPSNLSAATKKTITTILNDQIDAIEAANTAAVTGGKSAIESEVASDPGGKGGKDMQGVDGPTAGKGNYSGNWRNYRKGGFHGGADIAAPHGTPTYAVVDGKVKYTKRMTTSYGIHALVTDGKHDFLYGHMSALTVNAGDKVHPGTQIGRVGSTGHSTGNHLHFEVRPAGAGHKSAIDPARWLAEGGIVTQHMQPHVGEAGPEAVIPLNDKGMKYLADAINKSAMGRYWNPTDAQGSRSASHSTAVTNNIYTYDQRTQFMGEVEVKSQDPEDMARKLAARERRNRLARKTGSAA